MKKVISVLLLSCFLYTFLFAAEGSAASAFSGKGTKDDPYLISTAEQLDLIREYPEAHYRLISDISLSEYDSWTPIPSFSGVFDGQNHTVSGLTVSISNISQNKLYGGLFAENTGTIKCLTLVDCNVSVVKKPIASDSIITYAGGIVACNKGTVMDCTVSGSVSAQRQGRVGGICGANEGEIRSCRNLASVTALGSDGYAGGICGMGGNISYCSNAGTVFNDKFYSGGISGAGNSVLYSYNTGTVEGDYAVGGIVGVGGNISNCYNSGKISRIDASSFDGAAQYRSFVGGIVGESGGNVENCFHSGNVLNPGRSDAHASGGIAGWNKHSLRRCYNVGSVSGTRVGAISGLNEGFYVDCFYLDSLNGGSGYGSNSATRCTAEQLRKSQTYTGFDFQNTWHLDPYYRYPYPQLKEFNLPSISSVKVKNLPQNNLVSLGGSLDLSGASVQITYSDGFSMQYPISAEMVSHFDSSRAGEQKLSVSYRGVSASEKITILVVCNSHNYTTWNSVKKQTCELDGVRERVCRSCGDKDSEILPAFGHDFGTWRVIKEVSCTESGEKERNCSRCTLREESVIPALKHQFSDPVIEKQATCTEEGIESGKCTRCGLQAVQKTDVLGHDFSATDRREPTCINSGTESRKCSRCGYADTVEILPLGHSFSEFITKTEPTDTECGWAEASCTRCSERVQKQIPPKAAMPDFSDTDNVSTDIPSTTDVVTSSKSEFSDSTILFEVEERGNFNGLVYGLFAILMSLIISLCVLLLYEGKGEEEFTEEEIFEETNNENDDSQISFFDDDMEDETAPLWF